MATKAVAQEDRLQLKASGDRNVRRVCIALTSARKLDLLAECVPSAYACAW